MVEKHWNRYAVVFYRLHLLYVMCNWPLLFCLHFLSQADMKMTYTELSVIGRLRKISMCGPFSMFCKLIHVWKGVLSPLEVRLLLALSFGQTRWPS